MRNSFVSKILAKKLLANRVKFILNKSSNVFFLPDLNFEIEVENGEIGFGNQFEQFSNRKSLDKVLNRWIPLLK